MYVCMYRNKYVFIPCTKKNKQHAQYICLTIREGGLSLWIIRAMLTFRHGVFVFFCFFPLLSPSHQGGYRRGKTRHLRETRLGLGVNINLKINRRVRHKRETKNKTKKQKRVCHVVTVRHVIRRGA